MDDEPEAPAETVRAALAALGAPRRRLRSADVKLMLAETAEKPFSDPAWVFELKYDGYRVLAARDGATARLVYRKGSDATASYPEIARALEALRAVDLLIDGEVVVFDETGRASFQRLQRRAQQRRPQDVQRSARELPATLCAFDLVAFEGFDLRPLRLVDRKRLLQTLLPRDGPLRFVDHIAEHGEAFHDEVGRLELEGLVAKRADSPYKPGRSPHWLKLRTKRSCDFVVVGFTEPAEGRTGFGALHVGAYDNGTLLYCGRAGTGFDEELLAGLRALMDGLRRETSPCSGPLPTGAEHVWIEPRLVVEVRYLTWTAEGLLRQPVFLRLRDDKPLEDCTLPADRARELAG